MKIILSLFALLFSQQGIANLGTPGFTPISPKTLVLPTQVQETISCTVIVVTEAETFEKNFKAKMVSDGHNVPEVVAEGKHSVITAMADAKWLGLSWRLDGELVAESINLIRDGIEQPRVLIQYNPKNTDEQVSLDCSK